MELKDKNGNDVATTLYESYLSKAIIEHRDLYQQLFIKIAQGIHETIKINAKDNKFDRELFAAFTRVQNEFPGYENIESFLKYNFDLEAAVTFHKIFFECLTKNITTPCFDHPNAMNLAFLAQSEIGKNKKLQKNLRKVLNPENIFPDKKSGRIDKELEKFPETNKLGITTEEFATEDIKFYFKKSYVPGQNRYEKDINSHAVKWLQHHNLVFVSGISGTVGACYCGVIKLDKFSTEEIKTYLMVLSASLVSRGHHSFGEIHPVLRKLGFLIKNNLNSKIYYEQFLTEKFIKSSYYVDFLNEIEVVLGKTSPIFKGLGINP